MNIMNRKKRIVALVSAAVLAVATPSFKGLACDLSAHVQIVTKQGGLTIEARRSWRSRADALLAWSERDTNWRESWESTRSQWLRPGLTKLRAGPQGDHVMACIVGAHSEEGWTDLWNGKKMRTLGERARNYLTLGDDYGVVDRHTSLPFNTDYDGLWALDDDGRRWGVSAYGRRFADPQDGLVRYRSGRLIVAVQGTTVRMDWRGLLPPLGHNDNGRAVIGYVLRSGGGDVPLSLTRSDQEERKPTLMPNAIETIELPPGDYDVVARGLPWEDSSEHRFTDNHGYPTLTHPPEGGYRPSSAWEEERADGAQTVPLSSYSVVHIKVGKP
jgi:hypothetical protein